MHDRTSLLRITGSVIMLITFLTNEWVGLEVAKWLWAVEVTVCLPASSACIHSEHLRMWLFTLSVCLCLHSQLLRSPPLPLHGRFAFLKHLLTHQRNPVIFVSSLSSSRDDGWSMERDCTENIQSFGQKLGNNAYRLGMVGGIYICIWKKYSNSSSSFWYFNWPKSHCVLTNQPPTPLMRTHASLLRLFLFDSPSALDFLCR